MEIPSNILEKTMLIKAGVNGGNDGELLKHQPALNVDEQIGNSQDLGLVINDIEQAKRILSDISYFRLVKAYGISFKPRNGRFDGKTSFDDIVALYYFNSEFRQLLFTQIEKIEVTLRCRLANYFCVKYGVLGYMDGANFVDKVKHMHFSQEAYDAVLYNKRSPFIRNFQTRYERSSVPFYALVEILSFGSISKFFKNMKNEDKKAISKMYDHNWPYLESWFECLAYVRNICAHYGRLYDVRLDKTPKLAKADKGDARSTIRVFSAILCMRNLLPRDTEWNEFILKMDDLFKRYSIVDKTKMGFPDDWQEILMAQTGLGGRA